LAQQPANDDDDAETKLQQAGQADRSKSRQTSIRVVGGHMVVADE